MQVSWEARVGAMVRLGFAALQMAQDLLAHLPMVDGGKEVQHPLLTHWTVDQVEVKSPLGMLEQHLQSSRQNSRPRQQIPRSFLRLGSNPCRLT